MASHPIFIQSQPSASKFSPRVGRIAIDRGHGTPALLTDTPAILTATSRGLVPHFTRDAVRLTAVIQHIQLPFESFLDRNPPVPTLVEGSHPLHSFLGYNPEGHVITLTLRDPSDGRKMPTNGNDFVSAQCTRGVRKVSPSAWKSFAQKCQPDLVVALSDTPFTPPPHSQKRLTKSIERSIAWLADLLKASPSTNSLDSRPQRVLAHLAGGASIHARAEFSDRLTEPLEQKDAADLVPFNTLDDGVAGYVFDLLPLHTAFASEASHGVDVASPSSIEQPFRPRSSPGTSERLAELLRASLDPLTADKPRIVNSPVSPHEILRLIQDVGIDLVDAAWAQRAADIGIALDFRFPAPTVPSHGNSPLPRIRTGGKRDLGHNLFDSMYAHDHSRLASAFLDGKAAAAEGSSASPQDAMSPVCHCGACSPRAPGARLLHSPVDDQAWQDPLYPLPPNTLQPPFVRSYVHHLLHTHEMSSHSLLAMHNLHVLDAFLAGVRDMLSSPAGAEGFAREVERFAQVYDEEMVLWDEAEKIWLEVERARGKGRLAREREKQITSTIGTAVDL